MVTIINSHIIPPLTGSLLRALKLSKLSPQNRTHAAINRTHHPIKKAMKSPHSRQSFKASSLQSTMLGTGKRDTQMNQALILASRIFQDSARVKWT